MWMGKWKLCHKLNCSHEAHILCLVNQRTANIKRIEKLQIPDGSSLSLSTFLLLLLSVLILYQVLSTL